MSTPPPIIIYPFQLKDTAKAEILSLSQPQLVLHETSSYSPS
jgi:hypothetical protein